jgi:hypothetical protein
MGMTKKLEVPSAKNEDQPASRKMLSLIRDELKSEIKSEIKTLERKMDACFQNMEVRFEDVITEMKTEGIRTRILLEEQHSNNRITLEGLQALWQRQVEIEKKIDSKF